MLLNLFNISGPFALQTCNTRLEGIQSETPKHLVLLELCYRLQFVYHSFSVVSCEPCKEFNKKWWMGTSLVVQWLRVHLPTQGTRVRGLVREDPTCGGVTKSMCHDYWACALEPASHNYWARMLQPQKPARLEPVHRNKRSHRNEKPTHCNEDPTQPKINKIKKKKWWMY